MPSAEIAVEVAAGAFAEVTLRTPQDELRARGLRQDATFLLPVVLLPGVNELQLVGRRDDGSTHRLPLQLVCAPDPAFQVQWDVLPLVAEGPPADVRVGLEVALPGAAREVLVDADGDGRFETASAAAFPLSRTVSVAGTVTPDLLVRTADNVLVRQTHDRVHTLRIVPPTRVQPELAYQGTGAGPTDMEFQPASGLLFVLAAADRLVRVFDGARTVRGTISLTALTEPAGIGLSAEGDLFVADRGNHRVFKFRAPGFLPDPLVGTNGAFGTRGSGDGQFEAPSDVAVEGTGFEQRIFVCDRGNRRVQRCNRAGVFERAFDGGSGTTPLEDPTSVVVLPSGGIAVSDRRNVRTFTADGAAIGVFGTFQNATRICRDWRQHRLVVADAARGAVSIFTLRGREVRTTTLGQPVHCGLLLPLDAGEQLVAADPATPRLDAGVLAEDAPADEPIAVLQRFLAAIVAGDFTTARRLVDPFSVAVFDEVTVEAAERARIQADMASLEAPRMLSLSPSYAHLRATRPGGGSSADIDFTLRRDPSTAVWNLFDF